MEDIAKSIEEPTTREGHSGRRDERDIKELRNRKRGLEIRLCNISTARAEPSRASEEEEVRKAIVELQATICEAELAGEWY